MAINLRSRMVYEKRGNITGVYIGLRGPTAGVIKTSHNRDERGFQHFLATRSVLRKHRQEYHK